MIEPVRPVTLSEIETARDRIAGTVLRTPLVRLDTGPGGPDIRLKLENLQPTNSYKIRGAMNAAEFRPNSRSSESRACQRKWFSVSRRSDRTRWVTRCAFPASHPRRLRFSRLMSADWRQTRARDVFRI